MTTQSTPPAPMLGDHLAMDLLNTEALNENQLVDFWRSDTDVINWLARYDIQQASDSQSCAAGELLDQAKALRAVAKQVVTAIKQDKVPDITELNKFLLRYYSVPQLHQDTDGKFQLCRVARIDAIGSLLGPVSEALAQLLAEGNFSLVKQCEHPDCVLWFYDRTKAHKRRWCSMAVCGNRHKAAQFRKRNQE